MNWKENHPCRWAQNCYCDMFCQEEARAHNAAKHIALGDEEWRVIESAPAYEVSSLGRVKRVGPGKAARVGRILKPVSDKDGYLMVQLSMKNKVTPRKVHHLVLLAFVGPRPSDLHEAAHGDGVRSNNRWDNLSWKTSKANKEDKFGHGTHGLKLRTHAILSIRTRRALGYTFQSIGDEFGVTKSHIKKIVDRDVWSVV
jgi:hypothetical protein